jgi:NADPH2:quinone reductase
MKAVVIGKDGLEVRELDRPKPKPSEVLVRVRAAALNRADLMMAAGHRPGAPGGGVTVAGSEWAGEVVEAGAEVRHVKPGDRVMCTGRGGYAEYAVSDLGRTVAIPDSNMSFETAATLPVSLQTMHDAVVTNGRLEKGQTVLVQGASSGVGLMGLQIAKYMGASLVIGTSTDAGRRARLAEFGADRALDSRDPSWPDAVLEATGGKGVDLIVDQVSNNVMNQNMKAVRILGRIVNVGRLGGFKGEFDFDLHATRRITYVGVTFRTRSVEEVREIVRRMQADLWDAVTDGTLRQPIDKIFPLDQAAAAQAHMRANAHLGKIVLKP